MSQLMHKTAPLFATVGLMAWCCWAQVRETPPLFSMDEAQAPRIERRALHPEISPPSRRDPFLPSRETPDQLVAVARIEPKAPPKPTFDPRTLLRAIRLDATMVGTHNPIAIVNGRIYSEGQWITLKGGDDIRCRLQRIRRDFIAVKIEKEEFEVVYSPASSTRTPPKKTPQSLPTQKKLDLATSAVGKKDALSELLDLLKGTDSEAVRDECPPETTNETGNTDGNNGIPNSPSTIEDAP